MCYVTLHVAVDYSCAQHSPQWSLIVIAKLPDASSPFYDYFRTLRSMYLRSKMSYQRFGLTSWFLSHCSGPERSRCRNNPNNFRRGPFNRKNSKDVEWRANKCRQIKQRGWLRLLLQTCTILHSRKLRFHRDNNTNIRMVMTFCCLLRLNIFHCLMLKVIGQSVAKFSKRCAVSHCSSSHLSSH